jgi:hypothetical protein
VILATRFNLVRGRYDVRYVNLDAGQSFLVLTDDPIAYDAGEDSILEAMRENLKRYDSLISSAASMMFLPAFCLDAATHMTESTFGTDLHVRGASKEVLDAKRILGLGEVRYFRTVRFVRSSAHVNAGSQAVVRPPDLEFESSGYWRPLTPGQIGRDGSGNPIVGKTWVERTDAWSSEGLESFALSVVKHDVHGVDPGFVYIMRCGTHHADIYKIGLTRRTTTERARELSGATGVPTRFEVLAQWEVGDCAKLEAEVHHRLAPYRVQKRREFFKCNIKVIVDVINELARDS